MQIVIQLLHFSSRIDADPLAVAKYGVALLAKDLPDDKLKTNVCDDLSVFLQERKYFMKHLVWTELHGTDIALKFVHFSIDFIKS